MKIKVYTAKFYMSTSPVYFTGVVDISLYHLYVNPE